MDLIDRLTAVLDARAGDIAKQRAYFEGAAPKLHLPDRSHPLYAAIVAQARSPWAELCITAASEKMEVVGFRVLTADGDADTAEADKLAWQIWQANSGDLYSQVAFRTALLHGVSYVIVEPGPDLPILSFESPECVATLSAPGGRRTVAAVKRWSMDDQDVAVVWVDDGATTLVRDRTRGAGTWELSSNQLASNTSGLVPVFPMYNRLDSMGRYDSDLTSLYSTLDRVTQSLVDRLTTQYFASTRVRVLTGVVPDLDEDGKPTNAAIKMSTDRLIVLESPEARAQSFEASDLRQFVEVAKSDLASLAALARLPAPLMGSSDLTNISAESLRSLSQGLVARVTEKIISVTPALSRSMRLALAMAGDERVNDPRCRVEPLWAPVIPPSAAEMAAAAAQLVTSGVMSKTAAQEYALGLEPSQIEKYAMYERSDALSAQGTRAITDLLAAPAPTPAEQPTTEAAPVA
jgi:hypothetical protein